MHFEVSGDGAKVVSNVCEELQRSMIKWPLFNSRHEGYAVILEELDELWDEVKKRKPDVKNMRLEAVQVAAMAMKFIMSMDNDWKVDRQPKNVVSDEEKEKEIEEKCRQCGYTVLSDKELDELGKDPCDTCHDLSNWKPKK